MWRIPLGGPSDALSEGRWLPSTAVDQYGATLARWLGVVPAHVGTVFPNLDQFATGNLASWLLTTRWRSANSGRGQEFEWWQGSSA